ncbi:ABC transporter permease subunit [Phytohabitans sp. ZYX-F-186]|uniref:ABC transporter permease subunit n=1 Tax=Phytohabitans maris TaxID=3071409 RepID=A0ABU0ZJG5_9ACTN|nr:ABC transporter permease subunit [Phytohabitans sp. ZYX-F-186]MDQ7907197.1 ABC transporter permease subunit [Phytohabitans sp. ZYX-F-186]
MNLVRSEFLKIRTTNAWWLFGLGAFAMLALTFLINAVGAHYSLTEPPPEGAGPQVSATYDEVYQAANLYTSGQFFGLLFVLLLGIVVITSEFQHQTVTTTFLTTPHRTAVIVAKFVAAALAGFGYWLVTTALNIPATIIFLNAEGFSSHLGDTSVIRAIGLNLLAYVLWGILGVGFGVLIRSQIGATVTAVVLYLIGTIAGAVFFSLIANWLDWEWFEDLQFGLPSIASGLMVSGTNIPGQPQYWVGAVVLVAWVAVTGVIGTMITRTRDIS